MPGLPEVPATIEFGRFKVVRHRRELLADGRPVELGGRAFDTLMALIDARGMVLDKDQLMSLVWRDRVVEENNLPAQIAVLRKVFGADRHLLRTVAGRGSQFTGEIRATPATSAGPSPASRMTNLPEAVSELIGREAELEEVAALVTEHRLVSLVGAGGIGKTRLGLEVARHLLPRFPDGAFVAELGPLSSPELVPATVASALGLTHVAADVSPEHVAGAVGAKKLLLVIDSCEHVIEAATGMAEALLRASPGVALLATSREPLRVSGEYVYRVPPLDVPAEDNRDMQDVFRHGAVKLFVSRAHAAEPRYVADSRVAAATAAICRRLDGIPLAIELAATRIVGFGVNGVAARLDDRFRLLTGGSRTLARQQTMRATLDWSYDLLSESERVVLRRLGVFVGPFTMDAASAVAAYRPQIGDVRAALDWAFSPSGDVGVGVALTAATVPLWTHLSLLSECRTRVEQAIANLGAQVSSDPGRDMRLYLALGHALLHTRASGSPEMNTALTKAFELAELMGDTRYRLGAIHGLYLHRLNTGEYLDALGLAEKFSSVAAGMSDRSDVP